MKNCKKTCVICGELVTYKHPATLTCQKEACKQARIRAYHRNYVREKSPIGSTIKIDCAICKKPFKYIRRERGRWPITCSQRCAKLRCREQWRKWWKNNHDKYLERRRERAKE